MPWSLAHIANNHIDVYRECSPDRDRIHWDKSVDYAEMEEYVKRAGSKIIEAKGATFYAVAVSVCHICKCLQNSAGTALTVSTMMHGEYGIDDVCVSMLTLVDNNGVRGRIRNQLTEEEVEKFRSSANKLKEVIAQIRI